MWTEGYWENLWSGGSSLVSFNIWTVGLLNAEFCILYIFMKSEIFTLFCRHWDSTVLKLDSPTSDCSPVLRSVRLILFNIESHDRVGEFPLDEMCTGGPSAWPVYSLNHLNSSGNRVRNGVMMCSNSLEDTTSWVYRLIQRRKLS